MKKSKYFSQSEIACQCGCGFSAMNADTLDVADAVRGLLTILFFVAAAVDALIIILILAELFVVAIYQGMFKIINLNPMQWICI